MAAFHGKDLGDDRSGNLLRFLGAQVEPGRGVQARSVAIGQGGPLRLELTQEPG
jgi:hypothetical protein